MDGLHQPVRELLLERVLSFVSKSPDADFTRYMVAAIEIYYRADPTLSAEELLKTLEWLRFEITESMLRHSEKEKK